MNIVWPLFLLALVIPALAISLELRRHSHGSTDFPKIIRAVASSRQFVLSRAGFLPSSNRRLRWRFWLALALVLVALSRPQWGYLDEPVFDQSREVIVALDLSRSMLAADIRPNRLERAKLLITSLLERIKGERVGLVLFAGTAFTQCPLSSDYEIMREFLPSLTPAYLPEGGTNYEALLEAALESFSASGNVDRFLVVLSDGESLTDEWKPLVPKLKDKGIRVIGLGLGTTEGALIKDEKGQLVKDERGAVVFSKLEPATLKTLAAETQGSYADASNWIDLADLLKATVEKGRQGTQRNVATARRAEQFQWFLAAAFFLFLWSLWQEFPVHPRSRSVPSAPPLPRRDEEAAASPPAVEMSRK